MEETVAEINVTPGKPKKEKKAFRMLKKHPVLAVLLLTIQAFLLVSVLFGLAVQTPLTFILQAAMGDDGILLAIQLAPCVAILGALLLLLIHWLRLRPEFRGNIAGGSLPAGFLALGVAVVYLIAISIPSLIEGEMGLPSLQNLGVSLTAGISEEVMFRAVPLSFAMRSRRRGNVILWSVLLSSLLFGVAHGGNIFAGADPLQTLIQVVNTLFIGVILGAVYLRCGNILFPMAIHFLNDVVALCQTSVSDTGVLTQEVEWPILIGTAISAAFAVFGLWLLRPTSREKICTLWDRKWNVTEEL